MRAISLAFARTQWDGAKLQDLVVKRQIKRWSWERCESRFGEPARFLQTVLERVQCGPVRSCQGTVTRQTERGPRMRFCAAATLPGCIYCRKHVADHVRGRS